MTADSRYDGMTVELQSTGGLTPLRAPVEAVEAVESDDDRRQQISAGSVSRGTVVTR